MYSTVVKKAIYFGCIIFMLCGCMHPPFNNFKHDPRTARQTAALGTVGAGMGLVASSTLAGTGIGAAAGGAIGLANGIYKDTKPALVKQLSKESIQFVEYGKRMTLIVPTDKYYLFMSPRLNEIEYQGLNNIVRLLKLYPTSTIFISGFTDNVGTKKHKRMLSIAQAETMMTFLWANNIKRVRLHPEGYGDLYDIGDNHLIHGSAYNRRVEIQWINGPITCNKCPGMYIK